MASLSLKNITKVYPNGFVAVKEFNLEIADKEFIIFVGPSGCGKSTTLRMIAGLEETSSGELWIGDKLMNDVEPKDRDIAMVFQNYALYPHMSVYDNMAFGLKLRKTPKDQIDKLVHEAAKILDIEHLLDRKPKALSGGQRQRVAMGRAIVRDPKVFLMDEPLSNLDAKLRVQMRIEISKLHQRLESTIIYVTHDQTEAMTLGTRIVVMKDGLIQQCDSPQNLYDRPQNLFVAQFIGSPQMNTIDAEVEKVGSDVILNFGGNTIKLPESKAKKLVDGGYIGKTVVLG
ncbi:MAG: sn-glycerol-3-phosphate ABC transporter ATP-binding protein UgpC, partial [Lachnospiraceae bacterium]|nr:sn-glycerol-3-phosphate ABC transporter ATP-binding protein UgpC [Lachnospiraceae bacterium]